MTNEQQIKKLQKEIVDFVHSRKTLQLASLMSNSEAPLSSYAPFAIKEDCLYVLVSEIAIHGSNLMANPSASVLIIEDEDSADEIFARKRVNYQVVAQPIQPGAPYWNKGIEALAKRHGSRIDSLSQMNDFKLFRLIPVSGRYVKGFGRAFSFEGPSLTGNSVVHFNERDRKRQVA